MADRLTRGWPRPSSPGDLRVVLGGASLGARGLRRELARHFQVAGAARRADHLIALARRSKPHVIVLGPELAGGQSIGTARRLHADFPEAKLIFLAARATPETVREAIAAGASAFVRADAGVGELLHAIIAVLTGEAYLSELQDADPASPPPSCLTPRQRQVLELVAAGLSHKEIAHRMGISPKTVEYHKANLMARLQLHTTADLIKYALRHGLTQA